MSRGTLNQHSTGMTGRKRRHALARGISTVGTLAFVLQMLAWAVFAPAMAAGTFTILCTEDGLVTVAVDAATGQPVNADSSSQDPASKGTLTAAEHCPLCLLAGNLSLPAVLAVAAPPARLVFIAAPSFETALAAGRPLPAPWPRGPPAPSV